MVGRWVMGMRGEYSPDLKKQLDQTRELLKSFREALGKDKPFYVARSNHTDRLEKYIELKAPALSSLGLEYHKLVGMPELGITFNKKITKIAPNTIMAHGDEYKLSQVAGQTALKLMEATGHNTIIGHTHRQGIVYRSEGFAGHSKPLFGMEVGHLMDMKQARYLKPFGSANWQLGFGEIEFDNKHVRPYLVPMNPDGTFLANGKIYS